MRYGPPEVQFLLGTSVHPWEFFLVNPEWRGGFYWVNIQNIFSKVEASLSVKEVKNAEHR